MTITDRTKSILEKYCPKTLPVTSDFLVNEGHFKGDASAKKWIRENKVSLFESGVSLSGVSLFEGSTMRIPRGIAFRKAGQRGSSSKALTWRETDDKILADLRSFYPGDTIKLEATGNAIALEPKAAPKAMKTPAADPVGVAAEVEESMAPEPMAVVFDKPSENCPVLIPEVVTDPIPSDQSELAAKVVVGHEPIQRRCSLTVSERLALPATPEQLELAEKACAGSWWDSLGLIRQLKIQPKTVYCPERSTKWCPVQFQLCDQCQHHESCNMYLLGLNLQP